MQRRLACEQTMFETRGHALGWSRTMDNMNDDDALAVDPVAAMTAIGHGISGNVHGLLSSLKHSGVGRLNARSIDRVAGS
jgi:hypothetical protein